MWYSYCHCNCSWPAGQTLALHTVQVLVHNTAVTGLSVETLIRCNFLTIAGLQISVNNVTLVKVDHSCVWTNKQPQQFFSWVFNSVGLLRWALSTGTNVLSDTQWSAVWVSQMANKAPLLPPPLYTLIHVHLQQYHGNKLTTFPGIALCLWSYICIGFDWPAITIPSATCVDQSSICDRGGCSWSLWR